MLQDHGPVTTTDELIPSGETSSYRSNPLGLAEFTLSRRDPAYVGRTKEVGQAGEGPHRGRDEEAEISLDPALGEVFDRIRGIAGSEGIEAGSYGDRKHDLCGEAW